MGKQYLREILRKMLLPLLNERGEVGDADEDLKLDDEELAVMLDKDPDEETTPDDEEKPADDKDSPAEGTPPTGKESTGEKPKVFDKDGNEIPQDRWEEVYFKSKQADQFQQKLDLLKNNPDEYYRQYPDEKPAPVEKHTEKPALKPVSHDEISLGEMIVRAAEGTLYHKYDGMTLNEVYDESPAAATQIQWEYQREQETVKQSEQAELEKYQEKAKQEVQNFATGLASELFEKSDIDTLSDDEFNEIMGVVAGVQTFMKETGRGGGVIADAYYLMNRDKDLGKAKNAAAKGVVNALKKGVSQTVSTGSDGGEVTGFEKYEAMTREQLAEEIDKMPTNKYKIFLNKAPHSIRQKFPDLFD